MKMKIPLSRLVFFTCLCLFSFAYSASANLPRSLLKLHNIDLIEEEKLRLSKSWTRFLKTHPEALLKKGKNYKVDQYCSFSFEPDPETHEIDINSIKLLKHKNNFDFNLKAIEFLKQQNFKAKKENPDKPVEIEMLYFAF
jgi:hypothetical protein